MIRLQLTVELPDSVANEVAEAGLLAPDALAQMLRDRLRRNAADRLLAGATRASAAGSRAFSMSELQAIVNEIRCEDEGPGTGVGA